MKQKNKALVVLSGGQDSATCLGLAMSHHEKVEAISFVYGQRHNVELQCAQTLTAKYNINHKIVELPFMEGLVRSALLTDADVTAEHPDKPGLPASYVPNRNALFLTLAHAWAQTIGADYIYAGMCETDYSGYPDCRKEFVDNLFYALNYGSNTVIALITPLMKMTKARTFELAFEVGMLEDVLLITHTCYNGDHTTWNEWGFGCGTCPACKLRAAGWADFKKENPEIAAGAIAHCQKFLAK